jgi:hypothetical protein
MGIYQNLEDKWYGFVDYADQYIPIGPPVDKIDEYFPSFYIIIILFAIILLLLLSTLLVSTGTIGTNVNAEIFVVTNDNIPLKNVQVTITDDCLNIINTTTDNTGKINANLCSDILDIDLQKDGYQRVNKVITLDDSKATVKLNPISLSFSRNLTVLVHDEDGDIISDSEIEILCDQNSIIKQGQTSSGFDVILNLDCTANQIKASATGFEEKTVFLDPTDTRKTITLKQQQNEGTVYIETLNGEEPQKNVEITFTNEFGESKTVFTNSFGIKTIKLSEGTYTYVASSQAGETKNGQIELANGESKDLTIEFTISDDILDDPNPSTPRKYLALKVIDNNESKITAADVYFYKNQEKLFPRRTNLNGETRPALQTDYNSDTTYSAIITAQGYEKKYIQVELQDTDKYQEIKLKKGGAKLTLNVTDDLNNPEKNAYATLKLEGFNEIFAQSYTDNNGKAVIDYLPAGEYELFVIDSQKKDERQLDIEIEQSEIKEIDVTLITGFGRLTYYFELNNGDDYPTTFEIFEKSVDEIFTGVPDLENPGFLINSTEFRKIVEQNEPLKNFRTDELKKGTTLIISTKDTNTFPHETLPYEITRDNKGKTVYLRELSDLPNNNEVQLFLQKVYTANPLNSDTRRNTTKRITEGGNYWLYFETILNNENQGVFYADFEMDSNNEKSFIQNIYSINNSRSFLLNQKEEGVVDPANNENILLENAPYGQIIIPNQQGKKSIPIILEISIDANDPSFKINYTGHHGETKSFDYTNNFTIGESFCINPTDCETLTFDTFIDWKSENVEDKFPLQEQQKIFIGDEYKIGTKIQNNSDIDFGEIELISIIPKRSIDNLAIGNDSNIATANLNILPFATTEEKLFDINPIKAGSTTIDQEIKTTPNSKISPENYSENENRVKLYVVEKNQLVIETSPTELYKQRNYPYLLIKTRFENNYAGTPAYWNMTHNGNQITSGQTDGNGIEIINFNTENYSEGDELILTAYDSEGSLDGTTTIQIKEPFPIEQIQDECLSIKINGQELNENNQIVNLTKGQTKNFTIESNCTSQRNFFITTDVSLTRTNGNIEPNETQTIGIIGQPREGLYGAYPLQIMSIDGDRYKQIGFIDVVIKDPDSCFDLDKAIYDFRSTEEIASMVTNNCFERRLDSFAPKMDVGTNSVLIDYTGYGIPEVFNFSLTVKGLAVEGFLRGGAKADSIHLKYRDDAWSWDGAGVGTVVGAIVGNVPGAIIGGVAGGSLGGSSKQSIEKTTPNDFYFKDEFTRLIDTLTRVYDAVPYDRSEPDLNETNPDLSFFELSTEAQNKVLSELDPVEGYRDDIYVDQNDPAVTAKGTLLENLRIEFSELEDPYGRASPPAEGEAWPASEELAGACAGSIRTGGADSTGGGESALINYDLPKIGSNDNDPLEGRIYHPDSITNYCEVIEMSPVYGCLIPPQYPARTLSGNRYEMYYSNAHDMYANSVKGFEPEIPGLADELYFNPDGCVVVDKFESVQYAFTQAKGDTRKAISFGYAERGDNMDCTGPRIYGQFELKDDSDFWSGSNGNGDIKFQTDSIGGTGYYIQREKEWTQDFNIRPIEGEVYELGTYVEATPTPEWTDVELSSEFSSPTTKEGTYSLLAVPIFQPTGFVPYSFIKEETFKGGKCAHKETYMEIPNHLSPYVEFSPNGIVAYQIDPWTIPDGLRVFLKDGRVYAEYIGPYGWDPNTRTRTYKPHDQLQDPSVQGDAPQGSSDGSISNNLSKFLWKPSAETNSRLVVLYSGATGAARIVDASGNLIENGDHDTRAGTNNGYQDGTRFSKPGQDYPDGSRLIIGDGSFGCLINDASSRITSCAQIPTPEPEPTTPNTTAPNTNTITNFIWGPQFSTSNNSFVQYTGSSASAKIIGPDGQVIETGVRNAQMQEDNGVDGFFIFSKEGNEYPLGSSIIIGNNEYGCYLSNPGQYTDGCEPIPDNSPVQVSSNPLISRDVFDIDASPVIDFNLTKTNLLGEEYAILTVEDWVNEGGELKKKEMAFQIKLVGNENFCVSTDGTNGNTGQEFTPKLKFDWEWNNITENQCDTTNNNYSYCDATQFTISLFKKLERIDTLLTAGRLNQIPQETAFYSHLIKDNYSQNFTNDFEDYYTSEFANAPNSFIDRYSKFITQNKLSFDDNMPYGGIYQISIEFENLDPTINSLFDGENPRTNITVKITPIRKAKNYNPLYETPFNGSVGLTTRTDYGTTTNTPIQLNNTTQSSQVPNALKNILVTKETNLQQLNDGILFEYNNQGQLTFSPSQPTPVVWEIESDSGTINAKYTIDNTSQDLEMKNWILTSSNLGDDKCQDFEGREAYRFVSNKNAQGEHFINWNGSQPGQISLATTFFTPEQTSGVIAVTPRTENTKMTGIDLTQNNEAVLLNYYDALLRKDYQTLKGMFESIKNNEMCISKNSESNLKIFWNPEYLKENIENAKRNFTYTCE